MISIQYEARPDHIRPCLRSGCHGGTIGQVLQRCGNTKSCEMLEDTFELSLLLLDAIVGENFRRGEMSKDALTFKVRTGGKSLGKAGHIGGRQPKTIHAGLELYVKFD